jgi:hypothetical protein
MTKLLGIGWDVGGWMGSKQGIAAATYDLDSRHFEWIGLPRSTNIKSHQNWTPEEIVSALDSEVSIDTYEEVVIGIDASLGFPRDFKKLVNSETSDTKIPSKEIYNSFAYRETERHIYEKFEKKPLSATFDKLGNNTTLALAYALRWSSEGHYKVLPQQGSRTEPKAIIEVYPALVKSLEESFVKEEIINRIPASVPERSDAYDAAICTILALLFKGNGRFIENVTLNEPCINSDIAREEGWIYYI